MDIQLVAFSMGKAFPVRKIAVTDEEANEYLAKHKDTGVISTFDQKIFIADYYGVTVPSKTIKQLFD